jgi:uncharacterized protein (DUF486 family)
MSKGLTTILLLTFSNIFMTLAWYGHLKFAQLKSLQNLSLWIVILISWGLALFEYILQVPANKIGFSQNGGPFNLLQLKMIQEILNLGIFVLFTLVVFKTEQFKPNHLYGAVFLVISIYFFFKK